MKPFEIAKPLIASQLEITEPENSLEPNFNQLLRENAILKEKIKELELKIQQLIIDKTVLREMYEDETGYLPPE